jgi:hypothetical protein
MEKLASGIFSLLLGALGLWTGLRQLSNRRMLNLWKTTKGKVIERGTYKPNATALGTPAFRYAALVKYVYEVNGKEFINDCIHPKRIQLPGRSTREWAQKRADSFPAEVVVHYNAEDPAESYLLLTSRAVLWIVVGVGLVLVLIGVIILLI